MATAEAILPSPTEIARRLGAGSPTHDLESGSTSHALGDRPPQARRARQARAMDAAAHRGAGYQVRGRRPPLHRAHLPRGQCRIDRPRGHRARPPIRRTVQRLCSPGTCRAGAGRDVPTSAGPTTPSSTSVRRLLRGRMRWPSRAEFEAEGGRRFSARSTAAKAQPGGRRSWGLPIQTGDHDGDSRVAASKRAAEGRCFRPSPRLAQPET